MWPFKKKECDHDWEYLELVNDVPKFIKTLPEDIQTHIIKSKKKDPHYLSSLPAKERPVRYEYVYPAVWKMSNGENATTFKVIEGYMSVRSVCLTCGHCFDLREKIADGVYKSKYIKTQKELRKQQRKNAGEELWQKCTRKEMNG